MPWTGRQNTRWFPIAESYTRTLFDDSIVFEKGLAYNHIHSSSADWFVKPFHRYLEKMALSKLESKNIKTFISKGPYKNAECLNYQMF